MRNFKLIITFLFSIISTSIMGNNTDYNAKWSKVDSLMNKPLLKDAQKKVDEIRTIAQKDHDDLNTLKCDIYDYAIDLGCEYNITSKNTFKPNNSVREEAEDIIIKHYKKVSAFHDAVESPVEKACSELFMAKMVNYFIQVMKRHPGTVSAVKKDADKKYTAEDFRELSFEALRGIVRNHVDNIVKNKELLLSTPSEKYISLFVNDNANANVNKECRPSVFDAMLPSLISFYYEDFVFEGLAKSFYLPIHIVHKELLRKDFLNSLFADVISHHNNRNEYSSALSAELSRLQYLEMSYDYIEDEIKITTLDSLIKQYDGKTSCVVNAVVKKQEIMCRCITRTNNINAPEIALYPKQIINEAEKYKNLYPTHSGITQLDKNIAWLKKPEASISAESTNIGKGKDVIINISYANIDTMYAEIYRIDMPAVEIMKSENKKMLAKAKLVEKKQFELTPSNYNIKSKTKINIGNSYDYGKYFVFFSDKKQISKTKNEYVTFNVTEMSLLDVNSIGDKRNVFVIDGESGHPIKDANVDRYRYTNKDYILKESVKSSAVGKAAITLPDKHQYNLHAHKGSDSYGQWLEVNKDVYPTQKSYYQTKIMTDRSTYRPGQTVEGKVILTYLGKNEDKVAANKQIKLTFRDANYETIGEKDVTTNEFGSASFKFDIPTDRMNGGFIINSIYKEGNDRVHESHYIMVESYKLPVAKANVDIKNGSSIMLGSKLELEGEVKTFTGEAVGGTSVKYRFENDGHVLFSGETTCGNDGKFSFASDYAITKELANSVSINIEAILPSGETVTASKFVHLNGQSVTGNINGLSSIEIEKHTTLTIPVNIINAEHYNRDAEAVIVVATKEDKEKNVPSKTLLSKNIKGNGNLKEDFDISTFAPAYYKILLKTLSGEVIDSQEILVYDKDSQSLPVGINETLWIPTNHVECSSEKDAEFLIGSPEKDANVLVVVRDEKGNILSDEWFDISNEQKTYKVPFNKYFAGKSHKFVAAEFIIIRHHVLTTRTVSIQKKETQIKNEIEILEIVRNIVPGEKQRVKMKVKPTKDSYEIAAVMVDKSLPELPPHWNTLSRFRTYFNHIGSRIPYSYQRHCAIYNYIQNGSFSDLPRIKFLWDNINIPLGLDWMMVEKSGVTLAAPRMMAKNMALKSMDVEEAAEAESREYAVNSDNAMLMDNTGVVELQEDPASDEDSAAEDLSNIKVRENFVETAFFYPQLTTAADGTVEFEYTAPDALTAWRMIVFAHDKRVNSCITSEDLQTKMPFAVKASLPRFVRKGDKCTLATTITNNDENQKSGDVAIFIKDVATDKTITQQSRQFTVAGNTSKVEEWSFDVPAGVAAIEVKMVGKSGTFSDGEVHQLPVLPDGTHVVKSKSMHVRGGETKDFSIDYNEKEMKDAELTVEYTDNAVWQALMALPSAKDVKYDCATEYISTLFVNQMAQRIANLYPEIKTVIEEWQKEGNHASSPLEQNQELKDVLMQQTPWMYESKNESEQRAKIVELYDKDRIAKANKEAISKLQNLQQSDGGFAWFNGFKSSEYVTVSIVRRLVEMHEYGVLPKDCEKMLKNAVKYIDNALTEAYENEINKKYHADREWIFDVFRIRISYDKNLDNNTKKILDFYVKKANKDIKEMTLYGKASFAIVLNMKGDVKDAQSIVESLRQSAVNTEELGMYWRANQDSWGRYGNAIATHAMLTKAFMMTGCDAKELSDLRFHLITKKETTQWNNDQSTLAAIDALVGDRQKMDIGAGFKPARENEAIIKIGGKQVDAKRTSGDGYVKIHYNKDSFTPELCNIHVEQPQGQEGIGGIYISYDAPYSEITSGKSGIEIKKKMYKVVIANDGDDNKEMLQEIKEGEKLQKGDKVKIVMTLRSDRDIDFVQVLDLRAACLEPVRKRPGIEWADGKIYYQSITDSEYSMFFDRISKGTRVFEYTLHVTQSGEYTQGITKVIPHYCPAFGANSEGGKVLVK